MTDIEYYHDSEKPYGLTYGAWTIKWWHWALSLPDDISPLIDKSGRNAGVNQPKKDVWFLAGTWATEIDSNIPLRVVSIPYGRSILFPVINCEANPIEYPHLRTDMDLIDQVTQDENTIVLKEALVNNISLPPQRVKSDPFVFPLTLSSRDGENVNTTAAADGFWIFLKPLPRKAYDLQFRGACEMGRLKTAVKYRISVK